MRIQYKSPVKGHTLRHLCAPLRITTADRLNQISVPKKKYIYIYIIYVVTTFIGNTNLELLGILSVVFRGFIITHQF